MIKSQFRTFPTLLADKIVIVYTLIGSECISLANN